MVRDVNHVVVGIPVDELVVGIDAGQSRLLIDGDYEGLVFLGEFFLLEIERLLFIFLATEDTDLDVVGKEHGSFCSIAVGLQLPSLNLERDLVFPVGSLLGSGGNRLVVVENNSIEAIIDQALRCT